MSRLTLIAAATTASLLTLASFQAQAATLRVQCEKRADRSVISVDGRNLARGNYAAQVVSGGNAASSTLRPSVGDEAEFDFSSQPADIAAGATAIAASFISGGSVTGKIVDAAGNTVISDTVACRVRTR